MSSTYHLEHHQRYPHFKSAYFDSQDSQGFGFHRHEHAELSLVISGVGNQLVSSHIYPLNAGDIFAASEEVLPKQLNSGPTASKETV